jgi:hypothetical protein
MWTGLGLKLEIKNEELVRQTDREPEVWHGLTLRSQTDHNWWFKSNLLPPSAWLFCTYYKTTSWHSHLQEPQISNFKMYYGNQETRKQWREWGWWQMHRIEQTLALKWLAVGTNSEPDLWHG